MSRTENVELAVVCLLEDGGRALLQNRKKEDWHGWALPGGHVEPGESFVDAVIREMQEETGLTIRNPRLVGVKQFPIEAGRYVVLLFKAVEWSGTLTSSEEGEMAWIEYSKFREGLVVTPSRTPSSCALRICSRLAVSIKNFMAQIVFTVS